MLPESALSVIRVRLQRHSIPGQTLPESGSTAAPPLTFILICDGILFVNIISVITIEKYMMHWMQSSWADFHEFLQIHFLT